MSLRTTPILLAFSLCVSGAGLTTYPPLPILGPTALTADGGDHRAYLRWHLQLEDSRIVGWKVLQLAPARGTLSPVLSEPFYVARKLENGTEYRFAVVG